MRQLPSRMESRKTVVLGYCQIEHEGEEQMVMFSYFQLQVLSFAKSDSFKIFLYGLEVQQGTVLRTGRNKTQHCEAIVIPTSGRQNTVGCLTQ